MQAISQYLKKANSSGSPLIDRSSSSSSYYYYYYYYSPIQYLGSWFLSQNLPQPLSYSCLANSNKKRSGVLHRRCNHSDMRVLHNSVHLGCPGEGPTLKLCGEPSCSLSCRPRAERHLILPVSASSRNQLTRCALSCRLVSDAATF